MHRIFRILSIFSLCTELVSSHSSFKSPSTSNRILASQEWAQLSERLEEADNSLSGFGYSVASSFDGNIIAYGAPFKYDNRGEVSVYKHDPKKGWERLGHDIPGYSHNEYFGNDVALSDDGMILAVSAPSANGSMGIVSVFIYDTKEKSWDPLGTSNEGKIMGTIPNEKCGFSIALSKTAQFLAIGCPTPTDKPGRVLVFEYKLQDWIQLGSAMEGEERNDEFGHSVDILDHEGELYVAIGAPEEEDTRGAAEVYKWNEDGDDDWGLVGQRYVDGDVQSTQLGRSVSLGHDGTYLLMAVGFPGPGVDKSSPIKSGVDVYSISKKGEWWYYGEMILPYEQNDNTGFKVSLSDDGQTLAISSPDYSMRTGMVRVYKYNKDKGQSNRGLYELLGSEILGDKSSEFGYSIALSGDGSSLTVGSPEQLYVSTFLNPEHQKKGTNAFLQFLQVVILIGLTGGLVYFGFKGWKKSRNRRQGNTMVPVPSNDANNNDMNNQGFEFPVRQRQSVPTHDLELDEDETNETELRVIT